MLLLVSGGHLRRMTWLDRALLASFHWRAHPLLAALYTRARRAQPELPEDPTVERLYHGAAKGIDSDAGTLASWIGIDVLPFPALWQPQGPKGPTDYSAGPKRNSRMLRGEHDSGQVPPPPFLLAYPGNTGTADMVSKMRGACRVVLDLNDPAVAAEFETHQRWTKDDAWMLRTNPAGIREAHAARPGIGPPLCSGHWLKVDKAVQVPAWCEYIGREHEGLARSVLANPFPVRPCGKEKPGRVVVMIDGRWNEMSEGEALGPFHDYLGDLFAARRTELEPLLLAIAREARPLVCWCDSKKPCHGTVVARAAMQCWAREAVYAARAATVGPCSTYPATS